MVNLRGKKKKSNQNHSYGVLLLGLLGIDMLNKLSGRVIYFLRYTIIKKTNDTK